MFAGPSKDSESGIDDGEKARKRREKIGMREVCT